MTRPAAPAARRRITIRTRDRSGLSGRERAPPLRLPTESQRQTARREIRQASSENRVLRFDDS